MGASSVIGGEPKKKVVEKVGGSDWVMLFWYEYPLLFSTRSSALHPKGKRHSVAEASLVLACQIDSAAFGISLRRGPSSGGSRREGVPRIATGWWPIAQSPAPFPASDLAESRPGRLTSSPASLATPQHS